MWPDVIILFEPETLSSQILQASAIGADEGYNNGMNCNVLD